MKISGTTRLFLALGDPIVQMRAPDLFNSLFARHGVDAVLVAVHVVEGSFADFVHSALAACNVGGLCITVPHKRTMASLLQRCDTFGRVAGAVNAARRGDDGQLEGALFDGEGFVKSMDHFGVRTQGQRVMLVGTGGAGGAIAASLAARGVGELALHDTRESRRSELFERLHASYDISLSLPATLDGAGFDMVINATPLGMRAADPLPFDVDRLDHDCIVVDILMKSEPTALLRACMERGINCFSGHEMLVQQVPDYLRFFGLADVARTVEADLSEARALIQPR